MANIKNHLNNIKNALFGQEVRGSIHDGIDAINKEVESTTGRQVDLEKTFDQLVINAGNSNAEIVDARVKSDGTSYSKLGDRLNEVDSQLEHMKNEVHEANSNKTHSYLCKVLEENLINQNSLNSAKNAIEKGELRICFWGDSITEGADLKNKQDSYANRFIKKLTNSMSNCRVISQNFGLGGRTISHASSDTYCALSRAESSVGVGFFRDWSVEGKSWKEHIKDFAPDLIIIAFGMNDSGSGHSETASYDFATNLKSIVSYIETFEKQPSIVLIPTILPTLNTDYYNQRQDITNSVARATREFAKEEGYCCVDANRIFQFLRDGVDECSYVSQIDESFENYFFGEAQYNYVVENGNTIQLTKGSSGDRLITNNKSYNQIIEMDLTIPSGSGFSVMFRMSDLGCIEVPILPDYPSVGKTFLRIIDHNGKQFAAAIVDKTANDILKLKIESKDSRHIVYIDNKPIMFTQTYKCLHDGHIGFKYFDVNSVISNLRITYNKNITLQPLYSELEIFGEYNSNNDGNAINHPTGLGHEMIYMNSLLKLINEMINCKTNVVSKNIDIVSKYHDLETGEASYFLNMKPSKQYDAKKGIQLKHIQSNKFYNFRSDITTTSNSDLLKSNEFCYINADEGIDQIIVSRNPNDSYGYKLYTICD